MDWEWDRLREIFGAHARFVLCADHAERLDAETLDHFDEIWPCPLTAALARYEMRHLQRKIKAEKDDALHRQYLNTLIDMTPDLVWFKDMPGCHLKVNKAFCEAVDKSREDVTGKFHSYIWGTSDDDAKHGEAVCHSSELAVAEARHTCYFEEEIRHAKRGICQLKVWKTPIYDEEGDVIGTIGLAHDVTREKEAQDKILHLAHTDALTGLFNRRYMEESLRREVSAARRHNTPIGIIMMYPDAIETVNKERGHHAVEQLLWELGQRLPGFIRTEDIPCRYEGDVFCVILPGADLKITRARAERIRNEISQLKIAYGESVLETTLSMGVAVMPAHAGDARGLLQAAGESMQMAVQSGGNRVILAEALPPRK